MVVSMDFYNSRYFNINKNLLIFMGLWPYQKRRTKLFIRTYFAVIMTTSLIPQVLSIMKYLNVNMDRVIQSIANSLYLIGVSLKILTVVITEKKIQIVYENIVENWKLLANDEEKEKLAEYSEIGRLLTIGYCSYMFSALALFITVPLLPVLIDLWLPINGSRPRIFILEGNYIVDGPENYKKIYVFEAFVCVMTVLIFTVIDTTYAVVIQQCVGLMNVVKLRLRNATKYANELVLLDHEEKDVAYDLVVQSIDLHKKVINFANIVESSYSTMFLILMGVNILIVSFTSILLLINIDKPFEFFRFSLILLGVTVHMFYLSYPGQQLIDSSGGIFEDAYNNEWYLCSIKTQQLLKFMMLRCMEPCQLTAGGLYIMNIINCGSFVKTSISYITVFASFR